MVIDTDQIAGLFQNWGAVQWAIAAVMAFLVGTTPQVKSLASKLWAKLPFGKGGNSISLEGTDLIKIVSQLELRRAKLVQIASDADAEIAQIDKMLGVKHGE